MSTSEFSRLNSEEFTKKLREAAKPVLTPEEFRDQAVSFIMESKGSSDTWTRDQVRENLIKRFGGI